VFSVLACVVPGLVIAISLTLQFNLFLEMPFKFEFPTLIFCVVLASILGACGCLG
jgi:ABC-type Fe3+ transport system permease subunit